ncbi:MAG: ABC transporter permease [Tissierellia bacterium]|nr:ABC transporter permease [Tissierellia bacterium]
MSKLGPAPITIPRFLLIYALLLIVLFILQRAKIDQTKLLFVASLRMTIQLMLAGFILTHIFQNPHPLFTLAYVAAMLLFAIHRVLSKNPGLNNRFKGIIATSMTVSGLFVLAYFVGIVANQGLFNPQYVIPISGMVMGNMMTGLNLALKTFQEYIKSEKLQIETLLNIGARPKDILLPFVNRALETAMLPTINSMLGLGIVSLPGMMTGQILAGTLPTTAIFYQIAVMVSLTTVTSLSVFGSLYLGYQTLYNEKNQFDL